ncbi:Ubr3, partial [Symbiodinium sp. CCMP2456]
MRQAIPRVYVCHSSCRRTCLQLDAAVYVFIAEARARSGNACAAGRLGVVQKEGSAPRLVGDSTVSNANRLCRIADKIELPSLQDVSSFLSHHDGEWIAFILDVAKAHKRAKAAAAAAERGYSLFAVTDADGATHWLCYRTCHFGCSWAAYWWARTAGAFVRIAHRLIHRRHFLAIYVDDILALIRRSEASTGAALVVFLATALGVPISWKKLVLGSCVKWLGWMVRLGEAPTAHLPEDKRICLLGALQLLRVAGAMVSRKHLEQLVGCRILEVGHVPFQGPRDVLRAQVKQGRAWVKFGDGCSKEVRVAKEEAQVIQVADFYHSLVSKNVEVQLVHKKGPHVLAAADAYAQGQSAGIGGWWMLPGDGICPTSIFWFSIAIQAAELPDWFVQEHGRSDLQKYICVLEALVQLVLSKLLIADSWVGPTFSCAGQVMLYDKAATIRGSAAQSARSAEYMGGSVEQRAGSKRFAGALG